MRNILPKNAFYLAEDNCRPQFCDSSGKVHEEASAQYYLLVEALSTKVPGLEYRFSIAARSKLPRVPEIGSFYSRGDAEIRVATPGRQQALNQLFVAIQKAINVSHASGVEQGRNLLTSLARGEITVGQLDGNVPPHIPDES